MVPKRSFFILLDTSNQESIPTLAARLTGGLPGTTHPIPKVVRRFAGDNPSNSQGCPEVCRGQPSKFQSCLRFAEDNQVSKLLGLPRTTIQISKLSRSLPRTTIQISNGCLKCAGTSPRIIKALRCLMFLTVLTGFTFDTWGLPKVVQGQLKVVPGQLFRIF